MFFVRHESDFSLVFKYSCLDKSANEVALYMSYYYLDEESDENTCDGHRERISINSILSDDGHISVPTTPSSNGNPDTAIDNFIRGTSGYESGESGKIITESTES